MLQVLPVRLTLMIVLTIRVKIMVHALTKRMDLPAAVCLDSLANCVQKPVHLPSTLSDRLASVMKP